MKPQKLFPKLLILVLCVGLLSTHAFAAESESQLDTDSANSVGLRGEWYLPVPGNSEVAMGIPELPFRFVFRSPRTGERKESTLFTGAFPVTPEMGSFGENYLKTAQYMERSAQKYFGKQLRFISFDMVRAPDGEPIYVMFLTLWEGGQKIEATVCYRFLKSYYAVHVGLNTGDMPEMFLLTRKASGMFADETSAPFSADPETIPGAEIMGAALPWELPVLNVFPILQAFAELVFAEEQTTETGDAEKDAETATMSIAPWQERQRLILEAHGVIADNRIAAPFKREGEVYLIETAEQLALLGRLIDEQAVFEEGIRAQLGSYRLENDLNLTPKDKTAGWTPIGKLVGHNSLGLDGNGDEQQYLAFSGNFDGNGRTITGLTVWAKDRGKDFISDCGMFGYTINARISGLTLADCDIRSGDVMTMAGSVVAWGDGITILEDCHAWGRVEGGGFSLGGIAGSARFIERCSFTGIVENQPRTGQLGSPTGGIAGSARTIKNCRADGSVKGTWSAGGLVGSAHRVNDSAFFGTVEGYCEVGGIVGSTAQVKGSYCAGSVTGFSEVGGIAGRMDTTFNVEPEEIPGLLDGCLMLGDTIRLIEKRPDDSDYSEMTGLICGWVGAGTARNNIFVREDVRVLPNGRYLDGYHHNGEKISMEALALPDTLKGILERPDSPWEENWKPLRAGCYPQLLWETAEPVPIDLKQAAAGER